MSAVFYPHYPLGYPLTAQNQKTYKNGPDGPFLYARFNKASN